MFKKARKVIAYNANTDKTIEFNSVKQARRYFNISQQGIYNQLNYGRFTEFGTDKRNPQTVELDKKMGNWELYTEEDWVML
ncbi:NUMOD1 domain-containing DNA-binding protein [Brucella sp. CMUL 015]|uniref:NUMOD1 domain-containing DNA-binding protein n=1 Tax=Brucella sp. CMUL 015 TaxID=1905697 RepID=UPI00094FDC1D|nr:NUMOD1 domain-containing DNA-binding protein [Brucella sp. CMUL 015]